MARTKKDAKSKLGRTITELEQAITDWQVLEDDPRPRKPASPEAAPARHAAPELPTALIQQLKRQLAAFE